MRRKVEFAIGEYYHVFNRGVEKRDIFNKEKDYGRFLDSMVFFNTEKPSWVVNDLREAGIDAHPKPEEKLIDVVAYCLNSNHFYLLLREKKKKGITVFMKKICTGYAMYFNKKYDHTGVLYQSRFKAVHIGSNEQLLHVSAYVNCNCEIHGFAKADNYPWSSFGEYIGYADNEIAERGAILGQFRNKDDYREFALRQIPEIRRKKEEYVFLE